MVAGIVTGAPAQGDWVDPSCLPHSGLLLVLSCLFSFLPFVMIELCAWDEGSCSAVHL